VIRRAVPGDAAAIAAVHIGTWQAAYEHLIGAERLAGLDVERRRAFWERVLTDDASTGDLFVAEDDVGVVAFASSGPARDGSGDGELYAIYALPRAWGGGAGPALMEATLDALRVRSFATALLWVLEDNPRARRFYERTGWTLDTDESARKVEELLGVEVTEVRYRIRL